jgi:hypothetical protein
VFGIYPILIDIGGIIYIHNNCREVQIFLPSRFSVSVAVVAMAVAVFFINGSFRIVKNQVSFLKFNHK